jgi:hypothetical protein
MRGLMIDAMSRASRIVLIALVALVTPATAAVHPVADSIYAGRTARDLDRWQRIDFRSSELSRRNIAQIKVVIRTKGPRMQGLIRIPGAPASNFDTGNGLTVVDLINVGNDCSGHADIVALELFFTQTMPGQFYEVFASEGDDQAE